jgi:hypothetical protein
MARAASKADSNRHRDSNGIFRDILDMAQWSAGRLHRRQHARLAAALEPAIVTLATFT